MNVVTEIWKDLSVLGFEGTVQTIEQFHSWIRRIKLLYMVPTLKKKVDSHGLKIYTTPTFVYKHITKVKTGKYGVIYSVLRHHINGNEMTVYLKTSPDYPESLLLEAILQSAAYSVLRTYGFPNAVPRVMDIAKEEKNGVVFSVEYNPQAQLFADYLSKSIDWGRPSKENDKKILSVFAQVATYLAILEESLGLNHRDLKSTNVLMIVPCDPWSRSVTLKHATWTLSGSQKVLLIDFGFACIGRSNGETIISAGEYMPKIDFCPKEGRDLFLFFASLWNIPEFRASMTSETTAYFHKWLRDSTDTLWAEWLVTAAELNIKSMYLLTNADKFRSKPCTPLHILTDISQLYPDIVSFS
jgi:serine/threonine protein kinase